MKRTVAAVLLVSAVGVVGGCSRGFQAHSVAELCQEVAARADAEDELFFQAYMSEAERSEVGSLIGMVKRSKIAFSYTERLHEERDGSFRLDYHWLEQGCSFQIEGTQSDGTWRLCRIWFCR